jgi:fructose-specific phosphotransferase system IIC component
MLKKYPMDGFITSLIVGFLIGSSMAWLASRINDRYTKWEKRISNIILKRGKREEVFRNLQKD